MMFDAHQIIFVENAPAESFYPGPMALKMIGADARCEVRAMLPKLSHRMDKGAVSSIYGATACDIIHKRNIKSCLAGHTKPPRGPLLGAAMIQPD